MLSIVGQTAGPIELKFCVDTHGWPGDVIGEKKPYFFSKICCSIFFSRATPSPSASYIIILFICFPPFYLFCCIKWFSWPVILEYQKNKN